MPNKSQGFADRVVFRADRTGLLVEVLPSRSLKCIGEACAGGEFAKDRIYILCGKKVWRQ